LISKLEKLQENIDILREERSHLNLSEDDTE
jgi:hypothetical protein